MDIMVSEAPNDPKDDALECQKAQEVIGFLLNKSDASNETSLPAVDFSANKSMQDMTGSTVTVSIPGSSPLNICHVSLTDSGLILEPSEIIQSSLSNSPFVKLEDGTTAFVQNFEPAVEADSGDVTTKFIDGQAVRLEDGTTAFIHAAPREGLQPVQLEDGTVAYLSQTSTDLFNGEASSLEMEQVGTTSQVIDVSSMSMKEMDVRMVETPNQGNTGKSGGKSFQCDYPNCQRLYTTLHHLKVHARSHTGDRPFKCTIESCKKAFSTGYGLKSHIRVHTGETPYKCPDESCKKAFKASGDLQKHVRTHTGERPFKCPYEGCDRAFTTSNIRKVHFRTHTGERPYICDLEGCGRAFASATNYKNHIRIHTGEKPYVCLVPGCSKRFTEYSSLYKHNVVHTHSKPYICSFCGKDYRQTSTLAMHKRTAHGVMESSENEVSVPEDSQSKSDGKNMEFSEVEAAVENVNNKSKQKVNLKSSIKQPAIVETSLPSTKNFPTIVTLQSNSSNSLMQEHPVFAVQLQEDGTLSNTMLVADTAQLAAFQQLAQQGQIEAVLVETNMNSLQEATVEEDIFSSKAGVQI